MGHEMRHGNLGVSERIRYESLGVEYTFSGGYAKKANLGLQALSTENLLSFYSEDSASAV